MAQLIEYFAENMDSDEWSRLQGTICAQGVGGVVRAVSDALNEIEDEEDPAGAADRRVARDRRKAARDARRKVVRDAVRRAARDGNPLDPEDPNRPEAMDGRRRVTAEDRALFASLYPEAKLPEFVGDSSPRRKARPATRATAEIIEKLYPDAQPTAHSPGGLVKVIL
jgi:hypothetical protein